jgi:hypothetical protein
MAESSRERIGVVGKPFCPRFPLGRDERTRPAGRLTAIQRFAEGFATAAFKMAAQLLERLGPAVSRMTKKRVVMLGKVMRIRLLILRGAAKAIQGPTACAPTSGSARCLAM